MNRTKGYFWGEYEVLFGEYSGPDFSRRCFIFPGQGSASPGMFKEEYSNFKIIRDKFALSDSLAKKFDLPKISDYVLNPNKIKKEILPAIANLALFTLESALFDILVSLKIIPRVVTGHSFGEYAALTASGVVSFEEMFEIIYYRDHFCPPTNSVGFMIAVSADAQKIETILKKEKYYISNFNSPKQTVISVAKNTVDTITRILESEKIRYKILYNIPQPYHSPYLDGVKKKIKQYFKNKKNHFKEPEIPLFSSVLRKIIDKNNFQREDIKKILLNQITTPVDFISQIKSIYDLKCFNFLELGNKKLFSVFVEDILVGKEIKTELASDFLQKTKEKAIESANLKKSKIFSLINKAIGKITGYEIEKISIEDKFQEDLGIDSIKKADILLTVLNEANIHPGEDFNTSGFVSVKDAVSYLERLEKGIPAKFVQPAKETNFKRYIFSPVETLLRTCPWDEECNGKLFVVGIADILEKSNDVLEKMAALFTKERTEKERSNIILQADGVELDFNKILYIFRFFRKLVNTIKTDDFNLILLSSGDSTGSGASPYVQCIASFLKSLKKELPGMLVKSVHFNKAKDAKTILDIAAKETRDFSTIDVLYKGGKRFTFAPKLAKSEKKPNLNKKSVVVAIGGAKGITFSLVKNIAKKYKPTIYLAGRSSKENEIVKVNVAELKKGNPKIYYESVDACDAKSVEKLFLKISKKHKKIDLVINGAGAVKIAFLKDKTDEDIDYEFNNKVIPASNVLNLSLKYKPKRIINFSSVISRYGSAGQSIYTSANALVSGLTEETNLVLKKYGSSAATVHFPPWDEVGMTENKGVLQRLKEHEASLLKPEKADELFLFDLAALSGEPVYYLDDYDDLICNFSLNNFRKFELLIGKLTDPFAVAMSKPVFKKYFDLSKDAYLKDHKINGVSYVPAAVGISMFLCLGNLYFKKFPILKNIIMQNPIVVKNDPVECLFEAENKNRFYGFSIKSNLIHFYGEAEGDNRQKAPHYDLIKPEKEIAKKDAYSDLNLNDSIFYLGPVFQTASKALIDKGDNLCLVVDNSKLLPVLGLRFYDKLIHWIDVLFQALVATALNPDFKIIPVKISKLSVFFDTEISNCVYAIPSTVKFTASGLEGNAALVNEKGETIIEATGVFMKKIGEHKGKRLTIKEYKNE